MTFDWCNSRHTTTNRWSYFHDVQVLWRTCPTRWKLRGYNDVIVNPRLNCSVQILLSLTSYFHSPISKSGAFPSYTASGVEKQHITSLEDNPPPPTSLLHLHKIVFYSSEALIWTSRTKDMTCIRTENSWAHSFASSVGAHQYTNMGLLFHRGGGITNIMIHTTVQYTWRTVYTADGKRSQNKKNTPKHNELEHYNIYQYASRPDQNDATTV